MLDYLLGSDSTFTALAAYFLVLAHVKCFNGYSVSGQRDFILIFSSVS